MVSSIEDVLVACFYVFAGAYALGNVLFLHLFNMGKKDMPLCPLGPFGSWYAPFRYVMITGAVGIVAVLVPSKTPTVSALSMLVYEMWALPLFVTGANFYYTLMCRWLPGSRGKVVFGVSLGVGITFLSQFAQMALLLFGFMGIIRRRRAGKERQ